MKQKILDGSELGNQQPCGNTSLSNKNEGVIERSLLYILYLGHR